MKYSIALAGVVAEFGVFMLLYLKQAWQARRDNGQDTHADLSDAIREGAVLRVRPKAMTVAVILAGLLPILLGTGTGVASLNAGVADTFSRCFVISRLFAIRFMLP